MRVAATAAIAVLIALSSGCLPTAVPQIPIKRAPAARLVLTTAQPYRQGALLQPAQLASTSPLW
jgi:hypothetical protein